MTSRGVGVESSSFQVFKFSELAEAFTQANLRQCGASARDPEQRGIAGASPERAGICLAPESTASYLRCCPMLPRIGYHGFLIHVIS